MSHIIGRPNDDLLNVMLGHGADPEQAFIDGSDQGLEDLVFTELLAAPTGFEPVSPP